MRDEADAAALLTAAGGAVQALRRAEADLLAAALRWAMLHPSSDGTQNAPDAAAFTEDGEYEQIAGPGCPGVAEWSVPELATALGVGSGPAKALIGHALQLSHRLPRVWQRVLEGDVDVRAARGVAEATVRTHPALTAEAADWVDQQVAPTLGQVPSAHVSERLAEALAQFGLAVEEDDTEPVGRRGVSVLALEESWSGLARVEAVVDLADALDLDHALDAGARDLGALGSDADLGARRAATLGHLARRQTSIDLASPVARRLDLTLHFTADTDADGTARISPTGRTGERHGVLLDQVRAWSAGSHTEVHVHPVVADVAPQATAGAAGCVFPWCGTPLAACTQSDGVGPLCRTHGELRAAGWSVDALGAGVLVWHSPAGRHYRREASGTARVV